MFRPSFYALLCCAAGVASAAPDPTVPSAAAALARLPLQFESNQGQMNRSARYAARASGYTLYLTDRGAMLSLSGNRQIGISLLNSNPAPRIEPLERVAARTDYFRGSRESWRTSVPAYSRVRYQSVYPGVDMVYYGSRQQLEYDFVLRPGADPRAIRMRFSGTQRVSVSAAGDLVLESGKERFVQKRPVIYQENAKGGRTEIAGNYTLLDRHTVGVRLERYDPTRPLVIDPVLTYVSYMGGTGTDTINAVKLGPAGRLYVAGSITNQDLSGLEGAYNVLTAGLTDIFVAILDTTKGPPYPVIYFSYLGGSALDVPLAMDVDSSGIVYLTGTTTSTNFPTAGPFQATGAATTVDAFVVMLDPRIAGTESLLLSSYLGGSTGADAGNGIAVGADGMIYVIGNTRSSDFPTTSSAFQPVLWGPQDAFIVKIQPLGGVLVYSTLLGGESQDDGRAIAAGANGIVYFAASTLSKEFPARGFNFSATPFGAQDIIIGIVDTTKQGLDSVPYATYFGGSGNEEVRGLAIDNAGNLLVTGYTLSTDFPVSGDAMQRVLNGNADAFVAVVNPARNFQEFLLYSTFLGGAHGDVGYNVRSDSAGNIYVTGYTLSSDFPVTADAPQQEWGKGTNLFVTRFKPGVAGRGALQLSTFLGSTGSYLPTSMSVAPNGTVFVVGNAQRGLPTDERSLQGGFGGGSTDGFLLVINQQQ